MPRYVPSSSTEENSTFQIGVEGVDESKQNRLGALEIEWTNCIRNLWYVLLSYFFFFF